MATADHLPYRGPHGDAGLTPGPQMSTGQGAGLAMRRALPF